MAKYVVQYMNKSHPAKIALQDVQLASAVSALKVMCCATALVHTKKKKNIVRRLHT